jgi:hypothetical protein
MARAVARKKGGRRVSLRKRVAKKRTVARRVQRKPRKMVHRKRAQPKRKIAQKKRKVRIAKRKARKAPVRRAPRKVVHRKPINKVYKPVFIPPPLTTPTPIHERINNIKDLKRRKEIVSMVIDEIRRFGGEDVMNRFRDTNGNMGLKNVALRSTASASGSYIGNAQVVYNGEVVNVFIKMFISNDLREDVNPSYSLLTEACITNEIKEGKYENIPTLMNSYGLLYSTNPTNNFYDKIQYDLPTHINVMRIGTVPNEPFNPVYFINERADEYGSPAITLQSFINQVPNTKYSSNYVRSLFFEGLDLNKLRIDVYSVFVQVILTIQLMHQAGLYHNDIHGGNIFVVSLPEPVHIIFGGNTFWTNHLVRIYDWDRSFSTACNPLTLNKMTYSNLCQSIRDPSNVDTDVCYKPHEDLAWGDFWLVMYTFIIGNIPFATPSSGPEINERAKELINLLTNMTYNGEFWSEKHRIDFDQLIANLKPEHLAQIRS